MLVPVGYHRAENFMRHNPVMQSGRGAGKGIGRNDHKNRRWQEREEHAYCAERHAGRAEADPEPSPRGKPFHNVMTFDMIVLPLGLLRREFTKSLQKLSVAKIGDKSPKCHQRD